MMGSDTTQPDRGQDDAFAIQTYQLTRVFDSLVAVDGIDLDNHIGASYYLKDRLEGEKFLDHLSLVQAMGLEGSTGTWEKVEEDTEEVRKAMSSKMVGFHDVFFLAFSVIRIAGHVLRATHQDPDNKDFL